MKTINDISPIGLHKMYVFQGCHYLLSAIFPPLSYQFARHIFIHNILMKITVM